MDIGSVKAFADSVVDLHGSDNGSRIELAIFIWFAVRRFTRPITVAVQSLVSGHKINSDLIETHTHILGQHSIQLENHEKRIGILEPKP